MQELQKKVSVFTDLLNNSLFDTSHIVEQSKKEREVLEKLKRA